MKITIESDRLDKFLAGYDPKPKQQMIDWLKGAELKDSALEPTEEKELK